MPTGWARRIRSSARRTTSLATAILVGARVKAISQDVHSELERVGHEISLLLEKLRLADSK